jgi:Na+-transporting methylmalonyl-CoA/oxaloacetate decarboxylase gamma subunit
MNARKVYSLISLLVVAMILMSACAPAATPPAPRQAAAQAPAAAPAQPAAPQEAPAASADKSANANLPASTNPQASPYQQNRMIIKNGEMTLLVSNTDQALDQATGVATDSGGYIVSSKTWLQDGFKYAQMTMGIPSDQFEVAQRRLRGLALEVQNDTASGQDVSQEYVDLQSRLTNLEATAARIREFLDKATKVSDALEVNQQLSDIEGQIEEVKGRMQFLKDRSAFSTIALTLNPQVPTPTPYPTPTPVAWQPGKTIEAAGDTLGGLLRSLIDTVIYFGIVLLPFVIPVLAIIAIVMYFNRRRGKKPAANSAQPPSSVTPPADSEKPAA